METTENDFYYVIPDIHGYDVLLLNALDYIQNKKGKTVIFLGDYIDRGPNSFGVLEIVMNPPKDMEFICLKGNHEDMLTIESGSWDEIYFYCPIFEAVSGGRLDKKYCDFIDNLKYYHKIDNNVFVHAAIDFTVPLNEQREQTMLWFRYNKGALANTDEYFLTHGHTPNRTGPEIYSNRACLDIGAMYGDKICVGIYKRNIRGPVGYAIVHSNGNVEENMW